MRFNRLLVPTLAVMLNVAGVSLRGEGLPNSLSADESNGTVQSADSSDLDGTSHQLVQPTGWFVEPGNCEQLDGIGCAECASDCLCGFKVRFVPYGWLFAVHGNATVRGLNAPIDLSIRDTLEIVETDADMLFMGKLEVENDEIGMIINGFYFRAGFDNAIRRFNFNSTFTMAIVDMAWTYNLMSDPEALSLPYLSRFDLLAGMRYWLLDGGVTVTGPLGNTRSDSGEKEWVDPIIGGRIIVPLCEGADAQIRGDVGGFDWGTASEFTWNFEALAAVQCNEWLSLRGGYRILDVNNHRGSGGTRFGLDAQFRGPVVEVAIEF
jgi:hypothetical protein